MPRGETRHVATQSNYFPTIVDGYDAKLTIETKPGSQSQGKQMISTGLQLEPYPVRTQSNTDHVMELPLVSKISKS